MCVHHLVIKIVLAANRGSCRCPCLVFSTVYIQMITIKQDKDKRATTSVGVFAVLCHPRMICGIGECLVIHLKVKEKTQIVGMKRKTHT